MFLMVFANKGTIFSALAIIAAGLLVLAPVEAGASCVWSVLPSPNQNIAKFGNGLTMVSADSATDAWAVGSYRDRVTGDSFTLTEHWKGTSWQIVSSPNAPASQNNLGSKGFEPIAEDATPDSPKTKGRMPGAELLGAGSAALSQSYSALQGVGALTPTNAWAVGTHYSYTGRFYLPLIQHWNGVAWSIVPSPAVQGGLLFGVKIVSSDDVWAVGYIINPSRTLIEHWNGKAWSVVRSPNPSTVANRLYSITASSSKDVWAVGYYKTAAGQYPTLAEHWNGTTWSVVASPDAGVSNSLNGVSALAANDVFAVGDYFDANVRKFQTLAEHWNGSSWVIQRIPNQGNFETDLYDVAAVSPTEVLAVGAFRYPSGLSQTYAARWTGAGWMTTITPNTRDNDYLVGASAIPKSSDVWGVGGTYLHDFSSDATLIERYHC